MLTSYTEIRLLIQVALKDGVIYIALGTGELG